jgi:hypothetical protein
MIPYKQLKLADVFEECQETFDSIIFEIRHISFLPYPPSYLL